MKLIIILFSLIIFVQCEKQTYNVYECKECTTVELITGEPVKVYVVFACGEEEIRKRERLNYYVIDSTNNKITILMTTCIKGNIKN
jgi:hypothetical protein